MTSQRLILKKVATGVETELSGELIVGRSADSGLVLAQASRRHARITAGDGGAWVEDLGSTNGTYVNERRIVGRTPLSSGDRIRFDLEEFEFQVIRPEVPPDQEATAQRALPTPLEKERRPGAWADPNSSQARGSKTVLVGSDEMRNKLREEKAKLAAREPQRVSVPSLLVTSGSRDQTTIPLRTTGARMEWTIGSDAEREIVFADSGVSGLHAVLVNDGSRWQLKDQLSANGTYVNGKRINMSYLSSGDLVRFGPVQCTFQLPEGGIASVLGGGSSARGTTSKPRGAPIALIGAISFVVTALIIFVLWWHNR